MPATATTDKLFEVKPLWSGQIGSGGVASSASTIIPLNASTNLTNGNAYVMHANRVDANGTKNTDPTTRETFVGVLSGINMTSCVRGVEGVADAWAEGTVVEILFTAKHWNALIEWAEVEHNADGTHGDVTATSVTTDTITSETTNSYLDLNGNGSGGVDVNKLRFSGGGVVLDGIKDEDDMSSDSPTHVPTQQSVKAYVDNSVGGSLQDTDHSGSSTTSSSTYANITGADTSVTLTSISHIMLVTTIQVYANPGALTGSVDYSIQFHDGTSSIGQPIGTSLIQGNTRVTLTMVHIVPSASVATHTYTVQHKSNNGSLSCTAEVINFVALAVPV